ncbi:MAG: ABC transporter permease, partial [Acidimicrobiales bacterium]
VIVGLVLTALTLGLGVLAYGVTFPGRYLGLVVMIAAGSFCFSALGVAISTFVPNEDAGPAIINFVIFPLLFISGTFGRIQPGSGLERLASIFPIQHLNTEAIAVMNPHAPGTGILATQVGILLLWGAIGIVVSVRRFRWEPRTHT